MGLVVDRKGLKKQRKITENTKKPHPQLPPPHLALEGLVLLHVTCRERDLLFYLHPILKQANLPSEPVMSHHTVKLDKVCHHTMTLTVNPVDFNS